MKDLTLRTDEQLVALFMSGNESAFDVLLHRHKDRLYSYINYMVRNSDLADDLFQETFVKVIVTLRQGRYKESGCFYAWLTRVAHNLLIDQLRLERTNRLIYDEGENSLWREETVPADNFRESELVNEQVLTDVRRIMDHLPENQRKVVFMRFYQGLSFKEISEITGVSINTALGRMHYGIQNMRRLAAQHRISLCLE